jgi:enoyl-CoA hydratase/carnithine racemase
VAMPEITIGLYPDVAGSWLLERMPGRVGLFLGLTGAIIDAADALFCGFADLAIDNERRADVLRAIQSAPWTGEPRADRTAMSRLLADHALRLPPSNLRQHFDLINELMAGDDLRAIAARLREHRSDDPWLTKAVATFAHGSPTTAALVFELRRRVRHLSLADVFRLEYDVSLGCCAHHDFVEGIRALLIDKDRTPRWSPATLDDVTPALVEDHFRARSAPLDGPGQP